MSQILKITVSKHLNHGLPAFSLFLSSLWQALPGSRLQRLFGLQQHISLEIVGQPDNVHYQIWVPSAGLGRLVLTQLRAHFPDVEVVPQDGTLPMCRAIASAELVLALDRGKPLRTLKSNDADPMAGILGSLSGLAADEQAIIQILVRPLLGAGPVGLAFEAIIRLAAGGTTPLYARHRLREMVAAFGAFGGENTLKPIHVQVQPGSALPAITARQWPWFHLTPMLLRLEELASIYHLPDPAQVLNPYLEVTGAKRLVPPRELSGKGIRIGVIPCNGRERYVHLDPQSLLRHMAIFGGTGTGKSTLLASIGVDLASQGQALTAMEPHGDLIPALIARLPGERLDDVIVVHFADTAYPVGLNVLEERPGLEFQVVDELVGIFQRMFGREYWGPLLDMHVRHAAYAVLETGGTLVEMARILDDSEYCLSVLPRVTNPETRHFLERLCAMQGGRQQQVASTVHRLQRILGTPFIRNIVGQKRSTLNVRVVMDQGKILLVDLSGVGESNARFLGSLLTLRFRQAALSREDTPARRRRPHVLIMDESAWFISRTVGEMADQVRKFGLRLILAAQRLGQLKPEDTRAAILANVGSMVCFRTGDRDEARTLARHLNTAGLSEDDIRTLGKYEAYAQVTLDGDRLPAFWARTPPLPAVVRTDDEIGELLERSRREYARPRREVEERIARRDRNRSYDEPEKRPCEDDTAD